MTRIYIPARYASSRFPGKALVPITGFQYPDTESFEPTRTLIRRTWEVAMVADVGPVTVLTDDLRIHEHVLGFGGDSRMTPTVMQNGTERCAFAAATSPNLPPDEVVINLQGDACLTPPEWVRDLAAFMRNTPQAEVATMVAIMKGGEQPRPGDVRALMGYDHHGMGGKAHALHFTRLWPAYPLQAMRHFGIYAYRMPALIAYADYQAGLLEREEGLEQLRFLEKGIAKVHLVSSAAGRVPIGEVNYPSDVPLIEQELRACGIA
jgi:3-deoxy-manno-octulosonate cytidylyltransferase (CMP-KDO synthetase)